MVKPSIEIGLVLRNPAVKISGDAGIERAGAAGQDIDPELVVEIIAHGEDGSTVGIERTP